MHFCPRLPPSKLDVNLIFRMFMIGILSIGFVMDILKSYVYSQFYKLQWNLISHPFSYPKSLKRAISRPYFLHKLLHQKISMARDAISFSGFSWTYRTLPYNSYAIELVLLGRISSSIGCSKGALNALTLILESVVRPATMGNNCLIESSHYFPLDFFSFLRNYRSIQYTFCNYTVGANLQGKDDESSKTELFD